MSISTPPMKLCFASNITVYESPVKLNPILFFGMRLILDRHAGMKKSIWNLPEPKKAIALYRF